MRTATIDRDNHDLAVRFRDGDPDAVRDLYRLFSGPVFALCRAMLGDADHARDALQQTFVQAWRAANRFEPDRALGPWLYTICRRVCIDVYRRERRPTGALAKNDSLGEVALAGPSMEKIWTTWAVRRAIDGLPGSERDIVRLAHVDGWSFAEIAEHLDIPIGTVKSRSHRAHRRLLASLAHLAPGQDEERVA